MPKEECDVAVSVLVPVYNAESYLTQCLDSLLAQIETLPQIEFICVNDGSTDSTPDILNEYAQKNKRFKIISQKNCGYGCAMNVATDNATGEYIGIVEPDDYIEPAMFSTLYQKAKMNDLDFIKSDFFRFTTDEKTGNENLTYFCATNDKSYYNKVFNPQQDLKTFRFQMNTWSGIYKKSFIQKFNIRYNETPGASFQDNGFYFLTWCFATKAMVIPEAFYKNRRDNPTSSVKSTEKFYCMNIEYNYIKKCLERYPQIWDKVKGYYWLRKFLAFRWKMWVNVLK